MEQEERIKELETLLAKSEEDRMRNYKEMTEERSKRFKFEHAFEALAEYLLKKK